MTIIEWIIIKLLWSIMKRLICKTFLEYGKIMLGQRLSVNTGQEASSGRFK